MLHGSVDEIGKVRLLGGIGNALPLQRHEVFAVEAAVRGGCEKDAHDVWRGVNVVLRVVAARQ